MQRPMQRGANTIAGLALDLGLWSVAWLCLWDHQYEQSLTEKYLVALTISLAIFGVVVSVFAQSRKCGRVLSACLHYATMLTLATAAYGANALLVGTTNSEALEWVTLANVSVTSFIGVVFVATATIVNVFCETDNWDARQDDEAGIPLLTKNDYVPIARPF